MSQDDKSTNDVREENRIDPEPPVIMLPLDALPRPKPKLTLTQLAWVWVGRLVMAIVVIATVSYIAMLAWNGLTDQTGLGEITWQDAACAFLLLRLTGMTMFGFRK